MSKTDPALKIWNWSRLVCKIDKGTVVIQTWFFIVPGYFTLRFYRRVNNRLWKSNWSLHSTCQHSIATFQEFKQWICRWLYWSLVSKLNGLCISQGLYTCWLINCYKVNDVQTFRTILHRYLYFISTVVRNTVSLAQHIISRPVRHIVGITFAVVHTLLLKFWSENNRRLHNNRFCPLKNFLQESQKLNRSTTHTLSCIWVEAQQYLGWRTTGNSVMLFYLLLLPLLSFPMCPTDLMPNWASCYGEEKRFIDRDFIAR